MKTGWLVINGNLKSSKFNEIYAALCKACSDKKISLEIKRNTEITVSATENKLSGVSIYPDFVLFWDKDTALAAAIENMNIPVFNSSRAIEICDDKYKTHMVLSGKDILMPKTFCVPLNYSGIEFSDFSFIDGIEKEINYPFVLKQCSGSFGEQVYLVNNREELCEKIKKLSMYRLIIQEYINSSKGRDLRLFMVGKKCAAAIIRMNDNDFRANIHLGGKGIVYQPNEIQINLARRIMQIIGLDFAGIDFLFGQDGKLLLCEVNSNAQFRELYEATGIDVARNILEYIDANS